MWRPALALMLIGCANKTDFDNPENVAAWVNNASALAAFLPARMPLELAEDHATLADPACPAVTDDGDEYSLVGDCTDSDGTIWSGTALVTRDGDDRTIDLVDFSSGDEDANTVEGVWTMNSTGADAWDYSAVWTQDGLLTLDVDYAGDVVGTFEGPTTWNGAGTITRGGFTDANGTVEASTVDQVRDGAVCSNQNASGTTTLVQDDDIVVVTYDGATDCDDAQSATWTLNGEDQGTVEGVNCSHAPATAFGWLGVVAALGLLRRRR